MEEKAKGRLGQGSVWKNTDSGQGDKSFSAVDKHAAVYPGTQEQAGPLISAAHWPLASCRSSAETQTPSQQNGAEYPPVPTSTQASEQTTVPGGLGELSP